VKYSLLSSFVLCFPGSREVPGDSEQHRQSHIPVAKFRFDIGQLARQFVTPQSTSDTSMSTAAECKHFSLVVEGLEAQLRIATLTRIVDLINDIKQADVLPMRIDAIDVRLTLQVDLAQFRAKFMMQSFKDFEHGCSTFRHFSANKH